MFIIIMLVTLFIVLDIAALRWGKDSTETVASCESDRRTHWYNHINDQSVVC